MEITYQPILIGIFAFVAVVALISCIAAVLMMKKGKQQPSTPTAPTEPLPGGGGSYTMYISGMNCEHCRANAEAALNAFEGVTAQVDLKTETAHIRYDGYPDLNLLDRLREAVEDAGFTVTEIR
jgi:copper chaperone CopZ